MMNRIKKTITFVLFFIVTLSIFNAAQGIAGEKRKIYTLTFSKIKPLINFKIPNKYKALWNDIIKAKKQGKSTDQIIALMKNKHGKDVEDLEPILSDMGLPNKLIKYTKDLMLNKKPVLELVIKGAATAPKGTPQYDDSLNRVIPAIIKAVEQFKNKIKIKIMMYPGGILGDEPDFVRKIKLGELQFAGGTTVMGEMVSPNMAAFDLPFLFDYEPDLYYEGKKYCQIDYMLGKASPSINKYFMKQGFVLVGLLDGGGYQGIATKNPITKEEDLGKLTFLTLAQSRIGASVNEAYDFKKVISCKIWDLPSVAATGMLDSVMCCWYWHVILQITPYFKYVTEYPLRGYLGAVTIMQKDMFDGLLTMADKFAPMMDLSKKEIQKMLRKILIAGNKSLKEEVRFKLRQKEGEAKRLLLKSGHYKISNFPKSEVEKVRKKVLPLYAKLADKKGSYSKKFLDELLKYRDEYRKLKKAGKLKKWHNKGLYPDGYDEWGWIKKFVK